MKKLTKLLYPLYILFLLLGFFFVKDTLQEGNLKVQEKSHDEQGVEIKPVVVYLDVRTGASVRKYRARLNNIDTVMDLLEYLRENEDFFFEKIAYTYGVEFELVNNIQAPQGYKWELYRGEDKITHGSEHESLEDEATYTFLLEKTPESEN